MNHRNVLQWRKTALVIAVALGTTVTLAAVTRLTISTPFAISDGDLGDKPKIQRAGDGTLVVIYGDDTPGAGNVYDTKSDAERPARDVYVKTCKPGTVRPDTVVRTCDVPEDWSTARNLSGSALQSSIATAWQGGDPVASRMPYPGDIDKVNIKTSGPVIVASWIGNYCPDGDLATPGIQPPVQRAIRYLERDSRVIPFACTWVTYTANNGTTWSAPAQLSTGERDAKQDAHSGNVNTDPASPSFRRGQVIISWQEDPMGLQLGEGDGPGDGASGATVSGGTDVWYTYATVDLSVPSTPADDFVLASPARLTDNWQGLYGLPGQVNPIFDGAGVNVDPGLIEKGQAGASRANIGMVGGTSIIAYEETKGSEGLDEGKFIRYHAFPYAVPPVDAAGKAGCVISDPLKNGRRVRFLTQTPADAGPGGINIAIFWKEGIYDRGGPSDIVLRRGLGGLQPANMEPAVDPACATSDYVTAITLANAHAENLSSNTPTATSANLSDDTELNYTENALAHRGVLRGGDLWVGWNYTSDLVKLWAQLDNYNFWLRKYTVGQGWGVPANVSRITDRTINVREPRIIGTPKSSQTTCPTGNPQDPTTTDPTQCQNPDVILLAWGTQENVSPYDPEGGADLGIFVTVSTDAAETFATPVRYSTAAGTVFQDEEYAYESQIVTRPDGLHFYGVWNQGNTVTGRTYSEYARGVVTQVLTQPTGLYAASIVGNQVTLRWTEPEAGPPAGGYVIRGGLTPGDTQVLIPTGSQDPIFTLTAPSGSFYVSVHGEDPAEPSNEIRIFVNVPQAPSAPQNLVGLVNGSSVALAWRNTFEGGEPSSILLDVSGPLTTSIPLGLTESITFDNVPAGSYTVSVRAANATGTSASSSPVTLSVPAACTGVPLTPDRFLAYRLGNTIVAVWDLAASGPAPTNYLVEVTGAYTGSFSTTARFISGTAAPGTYNVRVTAQNACGSSAPTPVQTVVVP